MECTECPNVANYKCPVCHQRYCSAPCYQKHKEKPCSAPPPLTPLTTDSGIKKSNEEYEYPSEDTVAIEKLQLLGKSEGVKKCLENPHVRAILEILDKSPHPDKLLAEYMREPIFTEYVDECLKVVTPAEE